MKIKTVTLETENNFVLGYEAEGRVKNLKTLFILHPDKIDNKVIIDKYNQLEGVKQIYLGAGNTYVKDFIKAKKLKQALPDVLITCESLLEQEITFFKGIRYVITTEREKNLDLAVKQVDSKKEEVTIFEFKERKEYVTKFNDPLFELDLVI